MGRIMVFGILAVIAIVVVAALMGDSDSGDEHELGVPQATEQPAVPAADYEVVEQRTFAAPNGRTRAELRIYMNPGHSDESLALGIADAVRETMSTYPNATVFIVFAYSDPGEVDSLADVGRGFASTDGKGLAGKGDGLVADDKEGEIQVEVGVGGEIFSFDID